ncbi:MAG TPA: redoxin domain-containing protein [Aggregatilineales bacterium]|nr:redoxin domain-containing protein [Aggregatilineales bacterium]
MNWTRTVFFGLMMCLGIGVIGLAIFGLPHLRVNQGGSGVNRAILETPTPVTNPEDALQTSTNALVAQDYGPAPEFNNQTWLNADKPLKIGDQKGKVVLIEFWTFECINCQHTLGAMKDFYSKYHDNGLVIMTDHFPEFPYEADVNNVRDFLAQNDIRYPVAIDNDGATWNAYGQRYWPTMYLVDKRGEIRYVAVGEHDYARTETAIKALLSE